MITCQITVLLFKKSFWILRKKLILFAKWISKGVLFPSSMVDEITPATKQQDIINFSEEYGAYDPALVVHEEFFQWSY